jgi:hypothetical protein
MIQQQEGTELLRHILIAEETAHREAVADPVAGRP